jgi:uncharacterized protein (DUF305 family)
MTARHLSSRSLAITAASALAGLSLAACQAQPAAVADDHDGHSHASDDHDHPQAKTPGDAAFVEVEHVMHERMGAASGETVDRSYIAKMIEHHRGAVAMAEVAIAQSTDPEIRRMAQVVIDTQTREIAEMEAWKPAG